MRAACNVKLGVLHGSAQETAHNITCLVCKLGLVPICSHPRRLEEQPPQPGLAIIVSPRKQLSKNSLHKVQCAHVDAIVHQSCPPYMFAHSQTPAHASRLNAAWRKPVQQVGGQAAVLLVM